MDPKEIPVGSINYIDKTPPSQKPRSYWMVHGGDSNKPSSVIHYSHESAYEEAKRLAEINIGKPFFVLTAFAVFQVAMPTATKTIL